MLAPTPPPAARPLRVLEVMESTIGGTKRHLLDLLAGLVQRADVEVEVACPVVRDEHHGDTSFVADVRALGVRVHLLPMRRRIDLRTDLAATARLAALIRRGRYDLVHLHSSKAGAVGRAAAWLASLAPHQARPQRVYSPHGFAFLIPGAHSQALIYTAVEWLLGRVTDRLIVISQDEGREALRRRLVPARRVRLVRNGVDPSLLPDPARAEAKRRELGWGVRGESVVVGTVARMTPQKDPFTWLRAAARAAQARADLRFVWIMGGELEREVRALASELGLERDQRLQFLGYREDAREVIAAMDLFMLSSVFEAGLPYVLMEAMAIERPIVATAASGSRELIADGVNGFIVPPGDAAALADRVVRLAADAELRQRLGQAARALVLERCTTTRQVADTLNVYYELVGRQCAPARAPRS